jgi:hypothetical protein
MILRNHSFHHTLDGTRAVSVESLMNCFHGNDSRIPWSGHSCHDSGGFLIFFISETSLMSAFVFDKSQCVVSAGCSCALQFMYNHTCKSFHPTAFSDILVFFAVDSLHPA